MSHPVAEADRTRRPLLRLTRGPLVVVCAVSFWAFVISPVPSRPNDLFLHLRVGQLILETGRVPQTALFAWTVPPTTPFVYGEWLSTVLFFLLHRIGGLNLLVASRNLLAGAVLALVAIEAHRRAGSWRLAALAVLGAGLLLINNVVVRPQMFAWVPFGLLVYLLGRYVDGRLGTRWLVGSLALLMAFWVNVHGSFVLGLLVTGAVLAGELLDRRRSVPAPRTGERGRTMGEASVTDAGRMAEARGDRLLGLAAALGAMGLATLANPRGAGIYGYLHTLLSDASTQRLGPEWQPPTPIGLVNTWFYVSVLAVLAVWAWERRRVPMRDVALVCVLLWPAWEGARYIMWYGLAAMPILAESLGSVRFGSPSTEANPPSPGLPGRRPVPAWATGALSLLAVLPVVLVQPWFRHTPPPIQHVPAEATEFLRMHPSGRLFNERGYGSYLIWALPDQPVFIDPRTEAYPLSLTQDYLSISRGQDPTDLLNKYGASRVLLSRELQPQLSAALGASPDWERQYADGEAEVWRFRG